MEVLVASVIRDGGYDEKDGSFCGMFFGDSASVRTVSISAGRLYVLVVSEFGG